ncbi:MAG: PadR family transcriptional regulator [Pseudonocardia sp.]|nr:PadR family transcriptional regulator [Pseudonocardia sp.]MBO0875297.1 PadR family transcriptional regulator [Pseudonocardia sp.]
MSSIRLFVLSVLNEHGPMHGHQIRNQAQSDRTELWTEVKVGALYGALKRLAGEGLIAEVRSERVGNLPERTVYEITRQGREALSAVHGQALRTVVVRPDPFDLALVHAGRLDEQELAHVVTDRRDALASQLNSVRHQGEAADQWLSEAERMALGHLVTRLEAELRWHEDLLDRLPKIIADFRRRSSADQ